MLGSCLLLACTIAAIAAGTATAAVPELGRCVLQEKTAEGGEPPSYHAAYSNHKCTKLNTMHKGKYEWFPGPGPEGKAIKAELAEEPVLETPGGIVVQCAFGDVEEAEYTGPKTMKIGKLRLDNCQSGVPPQYCQTEPAAKGEIENVVPIEAELGLIGPSKPTAGWDLKTTGPLFTFTCATPPEVESLFKVEGSVIGAIQKGALGDVNVMNKNAPIHFKQVAGKQLPAAFEGGEPDTLTLERIRLAQKTKEAVGFGALDFSSTVEPLEVKTK
jgi:hypothetical protein